MILAGDIGGTNTRLALFEGAPGAMTAAVTDVFPSKEYGGLEEIAELFLSKHKPSLRAACFGVAGPVRNGQIETPNLPWIINAAHMASRLHVNSVRLLNDLEAN